MGYSSAAGLTLGPLRCGTVNKQLSPVECLMLLLVCVQVLAFPVRMLVRFWVNHHLLDLFQRPCWRVVKGRSKSYVDKVLAGEVQEGGHIGKKRHDWSATQSSRCM